ncbi:hypothetical protein [Hymenobacter sp.]|uniref:hypothetical protein n=1 Tax=Hymenobacter sp. TaxID=1898978 RepID=UPI002D7FBA37|nr:hypothetical protein [Hymenobacter sp.]
MTAKKCSWCTFSLHFQGEKFSNNAQMGEQQAKSALRNYSLLAQKRPGYPAGVVSDGCGTRRHCLQKISGRENPKAEPEA